MSENAPHPIHNPHDKFFKDIFGRPEVTLEVCRTHLPPELVGAIDWRVLRLEPASFIDEWLAEHLSDLLFSVRFQGEPLLLYFLFEHRSTLDADILLRLLIYMGGIWKRWREQAGPGAKPPCIIPIVLHQGSEHWRLSPRFHDWLAMPEAVRGELARFQPDFEHVLIDLSRIPLERLAGGLVSQLALGLMKAVRENRLEEWMELSESALAELMRNPDRAGIFRTLLRYAFAAGGAESKLGSTVGQLVARIEDQKVKEGVMTIAEELIQQGRHEAEQRVRTIAEELIEQGRREAEQRVRTIAEELIEQGRREAEERARTKAEEVIEQGRREAEERARTMAEELIQRSRLQGQIQLCQQLLGLPLNQELEGKEPPELETLLAELQARLRQRMK